MGKQVNNTVIKVDGLGKEYNIGALHKKQQHDTLRDKIASSFKSTKKHLAHRKSTMLGADKFWALRDVSFEVKRGEVLGIIGKNGAGKSTLLKILCKVTSPTEGKAFLKGRIGTLLEVGTGFHAELTGRENIYLSGAILGMKKAYIDRKEDEIIAFSGVDKFIDTPVKRYSSGMLVRLGFAVAAHLEPEILLIDEVLAVGDDSFKKKCLGKISSISQEGRTVLFVSHNMIAIKQFCNRAMLIEKGSILMDSDAIEVVSYYQQTAGNEPNAEKVWIEGKAPGNDIGQLQRVRISDSNGNLSQSIRSNQQINVYIDFHNSRDGACLGCTIMLFNIEGECVFSSMSNQDTNWHGRSMPAGNYSTLCCIPGDLLADGSYTVTIILWGDGYSWGVRANDVVSFEVHDDENSVRGDFSGEILGIIRPRLEWHTTLSNKLDTRSMFLSK